MNGPDTSPRWVIDRAFLENLLGNERAFKEEVIVSLAELKKDVANLHQAFRAHEADDKTRFTQVELNIVENKGKWQLVAGGAAMATFLITIAIGLVKVLS